MSFDFEGRFKKLTGFKPLKWQSRLYSEYFALGMPPAAIDIPTGLGKTSVMAIWYLALSAGAPLPRRLVYGVDRRAVVDQASAVADKIKAVEGKVRVSTLRGQHVDKGEWMEDPAAPAIIVGTVDMIGSRLLFSGYGVSRKMRPYHAGLLGADTLVVLDESHLVPPFEKLLDALESKVKTFGPRAELHQRIVPPFKLLSLSATGHERGAKVFRLDEEKGDLDDEVVKQRLEAKKRLALVPTANNKNLAEILAEQAWVLCDRGRQAARILIYCDSRKDVEQVKKKIEKASKGDKQNSISPSDIHEPALFVGARRVKERVDAERTLRTLGFLAGSDIMLDKPAFLIATSAGEVGVDLDADHMVCDLVPWERMVQRLGRVNRLGKGNAQVVFVHGDEPQPKKPEDLTQKEIRAMIAWRTLRILGDLPKGGGADVSPGVLRQLRLRAEMDTELQEKIHAATTPPPLYPALTRALVDAWSMTSLEKHTGRPEVAPWLRGWIEDDPQTAVVWRRYLPVRTERGAVAKKEVEEFFEATPPHLSEKLETESWWVADWISKRAAAWKEREPEAQAIVAFALDPDGALRQSYKVDELVATQKDKDREKRLISELAGTTLIVDARLGGLKDGLLDSDVETADLRTADDGGDWPIDVGFRIVLDKGGETPADLPRVAYEFATNLSVEGEALERLLIVTDRTEESRAESRHAQLLGEHQSWAERHARRIAQDVGLTGDYTEALAIAARLHDEGKKARRWQLAFNAPKNGVYAKTRGPLIPARLGGYRHEFGSLPYAEGDEEFRRLPSELQDLVLHLIAAHHGRARPVIEIAGCEDAPSLLETRARDVALRFARLQKQWGPWGLAWWEALLRAADQQASRENDQRGNTHGSR